MRLLLGFAMMLAVGVMPASAQDPMGAPRAPRVVPAAPGKDLPGTSASPAAVGSSALTKADVDDWLDGIMPYALQSGDISGGVVVVVKDGQILTARGFGYSNLAAGKPVDPARTLFPAGSVSKTVTWTAVMQLVEQGRIDLDKDVNSYLDFKIPPYAGQPVTMRELMTHTAGFEEKAKRLVATSPDRVLTTEGFVKAGVPKRVFPPSTVTAYSNYGASLAGYIVQRVSGEPFEEYVQRHVFDPLGMHNSTFAQPVPDSLKAGLSVAYRRASEPPAGEEYVNAIPAGALAATGDDMGRFMIAHLQNGRYQGQQILRPETARFMHYSVPFVPVPNLPGMAYGFYHEDRNGLAIIGHEGDTDFFHSDIHLILDKGVGLYFSVNSAGRDGVAEYMRTDLFRKFVDRYFSVPRPVLPTSPTAVADANLMAGSYISSRYFDSSFLRMLSLLQPVVVTTLPGGDLSVSGAPFQNTSGAPIRWREVGPFLWHEVNGDNRLAAKVENGHVVRFATDQFPPVFSFSPAPTWARGASLLYLALAVLFVAALAWPVSLIVRRHYGLRLLLAGRERLVYHLAALGALSDVICAGGFAMFLVELGKDASVLDNSSDPLLHVLQFLGVVSFPAAAFVCWNGFNAWRSEARGWWSRIGSTAAAISAVAIVWFVVQLHIIGPGLNY